MKVGNSGSGKGSNRALRGYARGKGGGRMRRGTGQDVYVLNPSGVHEGLPVMRPSRRFNPLTTVDLDSKTGMEHLDLIAEGLIVPHAHGDSYWDDSARNLIRGLAGHVLTASGIPARALAEMSRQPARPDGPPLPAMATPMRRSRSSSTRRTSPSSARGSSSPARRSES